MKLKKRDYKKEYAKYGKGGKPRGTGLLLTV